MKITPRSPSSTSLSTGLSIPLPLARSLRAAIRKGYEKDHSHYSHSAREFMNGLGKLLEEGGYPYSGTESLYPDYPAWFYLNAGDTYSPTLLFNALTHKARVGCIGDILES